MKGFGRLKDHTEISRGAEYAVDFMPKIKLETAIADDLPAQVIEAMTPRNEAIFFHFTREFSPLKFRHTEHLSESKLDPGH